MVGVPVIINHKEINNDNADDERVGVVNSVWYDEKDGWYWCDGIIWDETAKNLITDKDWSVSCSYDVKTADNQGGTENNIPYDMEFLDGVFTHLALVNNPRYERANIVFNSKQTFEEQFADTFYEAFAEVIVENCLGEIRNDAEFESKHPRKADGTFVKVGEGQEKATKRKEIKPYIPHFGRKPNPNFKYDDNKIKALISDIEPENINSDEITVFKDAKKLKKWVISIFKANRTIKIKSDGEEILLSRNSAHRATEKQSPDDKELNAVFEKIKSTLENSKYYDFEPKNLEHKDKRILGQYIYFSKINIDNIPYQVRFKIDVPQDEDGQLIYAGHRIKKI